MSALGPLQVLLDTTIRGDSALAAKLQGEKVYSGQVPSTDDALPYILLGQSIETHERVFDATISGGPRRGYRGVEALEVWSGDLTKTEAIGICADLERILDQIPLSYASGSGVHFISGSLSIISVAPDPTGRYTHASCRFEVLSFA